MKRAMVAVLAGLIVTSLQGAAWADPILGAWKTREGTRALITRCGGSFCVTLTNGLYPGRRIGKLKGSGGKYVGKVTDPQANKTYQGSGEVSGRTLKMSGCVAKIFCRTTTWKRF